MAATPPGLVRVVDERRSHDGSSKDPVEVNQDFQDIQDMLTEISMVDTPKLTALAGSSEDGVAMPSQASGEVEKPAVGGSDSYEGEFTPLDVIHDMVASSNNGWTDVQELMSWVPHLSMGGKTCIEAFDIWVELNVTGYNSAKSKVNFLGAMYLSRLLW